MSHLFNNFFKTNLNLTVIIQEIICLKKYGKGAYVINLDKFKSVGTHWIALYVNNDNVTYFYWLGVKYIPKEI